MFASDLFDIDRYMYSLYCIYECHVGLYMQTHICTGLYIRYCASRIYHICMYIHSHDCLLIYTGGTELDVRHYSRTDIYPLNN